MGFPQNRKPLICQAGSAEAFVGSPATGRERHASLADQERSDWAVHVHAFVV